MTQGRYWAFISYSHADEAVATWLHRALETYRLPKKLIGTVQGGVEVPARLFPVFRDRDELASAESLGAKINDALARAETLIVIASMKSATSHWVNEEIRAFKALGKGRRVFCVIADGEPFASDKGAPDDECFAPALRRHVDTEGQLTEARAEPIAADIRPGKDSKHDALLKLVAGILDVGLDTLKQRDLQRRQRRLTVIASAAVAASVFTTGLSFFAIQARNQAIAARDAARVAQLQAEERQLQADQTANFVVRLLGSADVSAFGADVTVRELLDSGSARAEQELADQPLVLARLQVAIGRAYWSLYRWDEGESLMQRALSLMRTVPGAEEEVAQTLEILSKSLVERERYNEAERYARDALDSFEKLHGPVHESAARMLVALSQLIVQRDRTPSDEQFALLYRARDIYEALNKSRSWEYVRLIGNLGNMHKLRYEWSDAIRLMEYGEKVGEQVEGKPPLTWIFNNENLARLYYFFGNYRSARPRFEQVISDIERLMGTESMELGWSLYYLARLERESGNREQAEALFARLIKIETATPQTPDQRYLARAQCGMALLHIDRGDIAVAESLARKCASTLAASKGQNRVQMNIAHEVLTVLALAKGDANAAVREAKAHIEVLDRGHDPAQTDLVLAWALYGTALAAANDHRSAEEAFRTGMTFAGEHYPEHYPTVARLRWARAHLRDQLGDSQGAAADRSAAQTIFEDKGIVPQSAIWTMPKR